MWLLLGLALAPSARAQEAFEYDGELGAPAAPVGIINGDDASPEEYPMAGALIADLAIRGSYDGLMLICSSTLIAPDVVMAAAHCMDEDALTGGWGTVTRLDFYWSRQADLSAYDGSRPNMDLPEDAIAVWEQVSHPEFDIFSLQTGLAENYDIALFFLEEPVTDIPHAYLPTVEEAPQVAEGLEVAVVGWGMQGASYSSPYGAKQQGMSYIARLSGAEFQVGLEEADVRKCHGDSGGPSFAWLESESTEPMRVIGVTSHAYDTSDCRRTGGVDTRVDYYLEWIEGEMEARCADGSRSWCEESGIPALPMPEPEEEPSADPEGEGERGKILACGCQSAGATGGYLLSLLAVFTFSRRRRTPVQRR